MRSVRKEKDRRVVVREPQTPSNDSEKAKRDTTKDRDYKREREQGERSEKHFHMRKRREEKECTRK